MAGRADEKAVGFAGSAAGNEAESATGRAAGWAGWLLARWHGRRRAEPRLALLERITLAPRHSLALVEAEGRRILVATSAEGGPAFYPLDENANSRARTSDARHSRSRVSW